MSGTKKKRDHLKMFEKKMSQKLKSQLAGSSKSKSVAWKSVQRLGQSKSGNAKDSFKGGHSRSASASKSEKP